MGTYSRLDIIDADYIKQSDIDLADSYFENLLYVLPNKSYLVLRWKDISSEIQSVFSFNGGDEDWVVVSKHHFPDSWIPSWIEQTSSLNNPDEYNMGNYTVWIGSHA